MAHVVGIYLYDDVEVLDFAGPFEVFSTAARVKKRLEPGAPAAFQVFTLAESLRPIQARGGLVVQPRFEISDHPALELLLIPGGIVTAELQREAVIGWIRRISQSAQVTASVCTGAFLLGKAGLLHGQSATTHWEDIADLRLMFPEIDVRSERRWVEAGRVITSAGISAGFDMSLHLVRRLEGQELAVRTARQMEYDWDPTPGPSPS